MLKLDKQICLINAYVNKRRILLRWRLETLKDITDGVNQATTKLIEKAREKRKQLLITQAKEIAEYVILLLLFKPKYKKILLRIKTGIRVAKRLLKI